MNKQYQLKLDKNLWVISWIGGGQMPAELKGGFSTKKDAEWAISVYEAKKKPSRKAERKVVKDCIDEGTA